jgi:thiol-disulfide isomerase/thioredoxin
MIGWKNLALIIITALLVGGLVVTTRQQIADRHAEDAQADAVDNGTPAQPLNEDSILASAELATLDGKKITIKSYRGKWLLLNFWATWCGPCKMEMPDLEKLWKTQHKAGLEMLAVSGENPKDVWDFLTGTSTGTSIHYPVGSDPQAALQISLDASAIPRTIILNPKGHVIYDKLGATALDDFEDVLKQNGFHLNHA